MKKMIALLLCLAAALSFAACGAKPDAPAPSSPAVETPAVIEPEETTQPDIAENPAETPEEGADEAATLGTVLVEAFRAEAGSASGVMDLAEKLGAASDNADGPALMIEEVAEGYLPGFSEDVTGFKSGAAFLPMIGSIPYAGYVFETEDPDAFLETIKGIADPRWNICTEADETVFDVLGNYVLFAMLPNE